MRPAIFVLNGQPQGIFSLTEHLTRRLWASRLGHENFFFYCERRTNTPKDDEADKALLEWARSLAEGQATMETVGARVDIGDLSRHLFTIMWCGTDDWAQGAAVLDMAEAQPRWRWVHWDMDRSFRPTGPLDVGNVWEKPALDLVLGELPLPPDSGLQMEREFQVGSCRGILFKKLLRDDAAYREFFVDLATSLMNHRLTSSFLKGRLDFYDQFVGPRGITPDLLWNGREFVGHRSEFVRRDLDRVLGLGPALRCEVQGTEGTDLVIDGFGEGRSYVGWYFAGEEIEVELVGHDTARHSGWLVDGRKVGQKRLTLPVRGPMVIRALVE